MGKVLWYDGEFYHSHTVNNETYPLFVQVGNRGSLFFFFLWQQTYEGHESVTVR